MKKYQRFLSENFQFLEVTFSTYLHRRVFVMVPNVTISTDATGATDASCVTNAVSSAWAQLFKASLA